MPRLFCFGLLLLSLSLSAADASAQVRSRAQGGNWNDPATWIGGAVPTAGDAVEINGLVIVNGDFTCASLTVTAGSTLRSQGWNRWLTVAGNVVNRGAITNAPDGWQLNLQAGGHLTNEGVWTNAQTQLTGTGDRLLTLGAGSVWGSRLVHLEATGKTTAVGDQVFTAEFVLGGSTLDLGTRAATLRGAGTFRNGTVLHNGPLTVEQNAFVGYAVRYRGSVRLLGNGLVNTDDVVFEGTLTVDGTLESRGWNRWLRIEGNVVNHGTIANAPDGWQLNLLVTGDLTNEGTWDNFQTHLIGTGLQRLAQGGGRIWQTRLIRTEAAGRSAATTPLSFQEEVHLGGSTLDMASHTLTLNNQAHLHDGTVLLDGVLELLDGATFGYRLRFRGDVRLQGTGILNADDVVFEGSLTVDGTLHSRSWNHWLRVEGDLVNQGTIANAPDGWQLHVQVTGDLANEGTWTNAQTHLIGTAARTLSLGAGQRWETELLQAEDAGVTTALTDQVFTRVYNLGGGVLDAAGHRVTLRGGGHFRNGRVLLDGVLAGEEGAVLGYAVRFVGAVSLLGAGIVDTDDVVFEGTLTVEGELRSRSWNRWMNVEGDLVNQGAITNAPDGWQLNLRVTGDLTNEGTWTNAQTFLVSPPSAGKAAAAEHHLYLGEGVAWRGVLRHEDGQQTTFAETPQTFDVEYDLRAGVFDLRTYPLVLRGGGFLRNGTVRNADALTFLGGAILGYTVRYEGIATLYGRAVLTADDDVFAGSLTVADTLEPRGWNRWLTVEGSLLNRGLIRNAPDGWQLNLQTRGDLTNEGTWTNYRTYLVGAGRRTIQAHGVTSEIGSTGERVVLAGDNWLPRLGLWGGACEVASEATLFVAAGGVPASVVNRGHILSAVPAPGDAARDVYRTQVQFQPQSSADSLVVHHFGHQVPRTYANAVRSWWRLETFPETAALGRLVLRYDADALGANTEETLEVYHSDDGGQTWRQISTSVSLERHPESDYVALSGAPAEGDYVLSSYPDPVSVRPTVITTLIGRTDIRVGPPNRYTVHYVNNSDVPSGEVVLALVTRGGVDIQRIEPSAPPGVTPQPLLPPDFNLLYDPDAPAGSDTLALLFTESLGPREERSFDVILGAYPDPAGKDEVAFVPLLIVFAKWTAVGFATSFASDVVYNYVEESFADPGSERTRREKIGLAWEKTKREWWGHEKPGGFYMKEVFIYGLPGVIVGPWVFYISIADISLSAFRGAIAGTQRDVNGVGAQRTFRKRTSWDPNEKAGPGGYGEAGYLSSAGRLYYQVLFENKAQATAPAWKIVVEDTLDEVFDPATVVFEESSHEGWTFEVDGQVLRWAVEGIELPPNVTPPEGEGFVAFSVRVRDGLPSGTALRNRATIVFDLNAPITTNTVVNTLDFLAPVTTMTPLAATVEGDSVVVRWQTDDGAGGCGVHSATVYAARDGGAFEAVGTTSGSALAVPVEGGHDYAFYALARDQVGNVEMTRPQPVATFVVVGVEDAPETPAVFALLPNYPNPFNPSTTFRFSLPSAGHAVLTVYEATGRRVAVLLDEERPAGVHEVTWDAGRLASGVYFVRLEQGDRRQVRSLVLLK